MENNLVSTCPRCNERLIATRLTCKNCNLELTGDFPLSNFDYLSSDELQFVEDFLRAQGNFKTIQTEFGMSYPAVKNKFTEILDKLNLIPIKEEAQEEDVTMVVLENSPTYKTESLAIRMIKEKLNESGGKAFVPMYNKDLCEIRFDVNGNGLTSPKIPVPDQLTWEVFEAAVEVVIQNGGKVKKGNARSGAKLGSDDLPLDSLEGYIAYKVHGVEIGKAAFGPGFVVAAILDWAEICNNERGFISIRSSFLKELENE